ncbi:MAG: TIGR01212 family radical SAM protein [Gammaproteobacteria bacterium]|nr:TIGR01212 family radical SAM protein [Gammaproteobacteria bacterium]
MQTTKPFTPISHFYQNHFGNKVYKISVAVAESCPNRNPEGGGDACIFCDEWGSAAYHLTREEPLAQQIITHREKIARRYRADRFLVYFQSYTNTFSRVGPLRDRFSIALAQDQVIGLVVGTRPDCLPRRVIPLLRETHERSYLMVELGVQSFDDHQLTFLRRGHSAAAAIDAISLLDQECGVDVGIHLIFGLPDEDDATIIETARRINRLPVHNVKLHNLHVLKGTPLSEIYRRGEFTPLSLEEYGRRVILFLRHLSPAIYIQRLTAVASRWEELIAPDWTREKMRPSQTIEDLMRDNGWRQGDLLSI